jgi:hypothetical protein
MSRFVGGSLVASGSTAIVRFRLRVFYENYSLEFGSDIYDFEGIFS